MSQPVPIALCGKVLANGKQFIEWSLPEYDVVHHCDSVASAKVELVKSRNGEKVTPATGLGSNITRETPIPFKAVIIGAGFDKDELDELQGAQGLEGVVFLYPLVDKTAANKPTLEIITGRMKSALRALGVGEEGREVRPGLCTF